MQLQQSHSLPSIRAKTAKLVLACLLPTLIGFGALVNDAFQRERTNLLREAQRTGSSFLSAVDRELETAETAARALSTSPSLQTNNLAAFQAQARGLLHPGLAAHALASPRSCPTGCHWRRSLPVSGSTPS